MSPESLYPFVRAERADRARNAFVVLMAALLAATSMLVWSASSPGAALASGTPTQLAFTVQPANGTADDDFSVTVEIQDEIGEPVVGYVDPVVLTLSSGTLEGTASVAAIDGVAVFSDLAVRVAGSGYTLTAVSGLLETTSDAFDITPGAPSGDHSTITASTGSASVDDPSPTVTVQAIDAYGNLITSGGATVELTSDQSGALVVTDNTNGTYSADVAETAAPLTHVISGSIDSDPVTTGDATIDFTPGAPDPDTTTIDAAPPTVNVDIHLSDITVTAKDQYGNDVLVGGADIDLSTSAGTLSTVTDVGDGTYTATLQDTVTRQDTVSGTLGESDIADMATVDFTPGALHHFEFEAVVDQTAGSEFTVFVTAYDQYDNIKTDYTGGAVLDSNLGISPAPVSEDADLDLSAFVDGVATATVTAYLATSGNHLTIDDDGKTGQSNDFTVAPGPLGSFTLGSVTSPRTAGVAFTFSATAYDIYSNVKTNYDGTGASVTSSLVASPFGTAPTVPANLTWGAGTGTGSASITAVKRELVADQWLKLADGAVEATTPSFAVNPNVVKTLQFSVATGADAGFNGQPVDTKTAQPIYSICVPTNAVAPNPCGVAAANSTGVQVLARDLYGNRVLPTSITLKRDGTSSPTWTASTVDGVADFLNQPKITPTGNFKLRATATGSADGVSAQARIVDGLQACDGPLCENQVSSANVRSFGRITTGDDFYDPGATNVLLTTSIVPKAALAGKCSSNPFTDGSDLRVTGAGLGVTIPTTSMLIVIPKETLKATKKNNIGTPHFNVCLGALWIAAGAPTQGWTGKNASGALVTTTNPDSSDPLRYWGTPADCGRAGLSATDPCIQLRTKQRSDVASTLGLTLAQVSTFMTDADLAIVVRKPFPWDGRGGVN